MDAVCHNDVIIEDVTPDPIAGTSPLLTRRFCAHYAVEDETLSAPRDGGLQDPPQLIVSGVRGCPSGLGMKMPTEAHHNPGQGGQEHLVVLTS
jgi:hypothetical protein